MTEFVRRGYKAKTIKAVFRELDATEYAVNLRRAAGDLLRALRDGNGNCMICQAATGFPHRLDCAAWPFIEARTINDQLGQSHDL